MKYTTANELTSFRKEIKYVIPLEMALSVKSRLDNILSRDAYCAEGFYSVRSLYFDSVNNIDFSEKVAGIDVRKKIRLRIYNNDASLCKLEIKQKNGDLQHKRSFIISADDAKELSLGNYNVLKNYFNNARTSIEAYAIMVQGCYRPVVQIEYDRIAYKYPMYDTRVTLDMNICSSETNMNLFSPDISYTPVTCEDVVLEIKYSGKLMGFISDMLGGFDMTQESYSKYCSGRRVYCDFNC